MLRDSVIYALVAAAFAVFSTLSTAAERDGVLVLHSGGVLHGQISVAGERYVVTKERSVVDVPATRVLLVADSIEDAYEQQRRQLPRETAEAHLALAHWCLRYDLLEPAAQELADARRLDSRDPQVAILERRLAVARRPKASRPAGATALSSKTSDDELRELENVAAELPDGVVERFARKVQPLLVNNCTTSGCHQPSGAENFQLDRAVLHGLSNRRTTLRNLAATLELIDRKAPPRSSLLSIPGRSHGGMKRPILGPRQDEQLRQLADWVALVTESKSQPSMDTEPAVVPASFDEESSIAPIHALRHGAELAPWRPKDEFDPEVFNRQFRANRSTSGGSAKKSLQPEN